MDRIDAVCSFVSERCGLYFKDHDLVSLGQAVADRMEAVQVKDEEEYYERLTNDAGKNDELRELINLLTINHTYFFRNERHMKALREHILPSLIEKKRSRTKGSIGLAPSLRVWSAGCSTGEEPYSLAIMLEELGAYEGGLSVEVLGTDVNTNAIAAANRGVYSANTLRGVSPELRKKYFEDIEAGGIKSFELSKQIKDRVKFRDLNLLSGSFPSGFDLISCRNVLIYFELPTIVEVVKKLFRSLDDEGYFFLGYSETMAYISGQFEMEEYDQAIYYRKKALADRVSEPEVYSPAEEAEQIFEKIAEAQVVANRHLDHDGGVPETSSEQLQVAVLKCIHKKEYDQAFNLIAQIKNVDTRESAPYFLAAEIHMNRREFASAAIRAGLFFVGYGQPRNGQDRTRRTGAQKGSVYRCQCSSGSFLFGADLQRSGTAGRRGTVL